jgi:hypothetical protein
MSKIGVFFVRYRCIINPAGSTRVSVGSPAIRESSEKKVIPECGVPTAKTDPSLVNSIGTFVGAYSHL